INEEYPRERHHPIFKEFRTKILDRFKNAYLAKRSLL
ncbi:MAG TPA: ABC transporter ATP-binding protein, partial [Desulfobacteraceae bacterium]|nr:ABC transporter ATP-binding protein [Desulfobacteraceae bacterium]